MGSAAPAGPVDQRLADVEAQHRTADALAPLQRRLAAAAAHVQHVGFRRQALHGLHRR